MASRITAAPHAIGLFYGVFALEAFLVRVGFLVLDGSVKVLFSFSKCFENLSLVEWVCLLWLLRFWVVEVEQPLDC